MQEITLVSRATAADCHGRAFAALVWEHEVREPDGRAVTSYGLMFF
jgi:hypothetical protein